MTTENLSQSTMLAEMAFTRKAWVDADPTALYDLISDVSGISRWSPNALEVQYDLDGGPWVGSWFSGRNRKEGREWISRSEMVEATPGRRFSYVVGGTEDGIVRWTWTFTASGTGTVVEQSWQVLRLDPVLGTSRAEFLALRDYMADSCETTLIALASNLSSR